MKGVNLNFKVMRHLNCSDFFLLEMKLSPVDLNYNHYSRLAGTLLTVTTETFQLWRSKVLFFRLGLCTNSLEHTGNFLSTSVSHLQQPSFDWKIILCTPKTFFVDTGYFCTSLCDKFFFI